MLVYLICRDVPGGNQMSLHDQMADEIRPL